MKCEELNGRYFIHNIGFHDLLNSWVFLLLQVQAIPW